MPGQKMIDPETLLPLIGAPDAPVLIDVCIDEDFALDPRLIPGAFRHPHSKIEALALSLDGREVVVICQKGLKLSQGAAALLRARAVNAEALSGGMMDWTSNAYPTLPAAAMPTSKIIAAERPDPSTLAALWLILRFVRRDAMILFVSADAAPAVADRFHGTVAPDFAAALGEWRLTSSALTRLQATLAGDTAEAPGFSTALKGLRALHGDDLAYAAASLPLFDALHRAYRDASGDREGAAA